MRMLNSSVLNVFFLIPAPLENVIFSVISGLHMSFTSTGACSTWIQSWQVGDAQPVTTEDQSSLVDGTPRDVK